ncbi:MAG: lytic transglycosylase domain-containing protein [Pseudomonadota bacterium]|nr:lytic transglycosylase domain-containing protein [Pseudomonadota bacterium]HJO35666.1 lytic transglycosylase domain-containing protein [Gammaproteobacteria bacterium]
MDPTERTLLRGALERTIAGADSFEHRFDAEVWLLSMSQRLAPFLRDPADRLELLQLVHREARRAELAPELVLALIEVESGFDRFAISHAGARGLMQVMPFWLDELERPQDDLFDVVTNLQFGCTILRHYLDIERGDMTRALARYNGSLGSYRYPAAVISRLQRRWRYH